MKCHQHRKSLSCRELTRYLTASSRTFSRCFGTVSSVLHASKLKSTGPTASSHAELPLAGIKVLDLSRVLAGPFATQILSDMGATILKIEQPLTGDETRQWRTVGETAWMWKSSTQPSISSQRSTATSDDGEMSNVPKRDEESGFEKNYDLMSLYFCAVNRNKQSMTLNLKSRSAKDIISKLVMSKEAGGQGYDIVVSNFLPGRLESLGLGYQDLKAVNPAVILAEVSGYGASGPYSQRAGYDAVALAEAGLLHITGDAEGAPVKPGVAIADLCTGLYAHGAILAAVHAREKNGGTVGCKIESSLFESALSLLINVGLTSLNLDKNKPDHLRRRGKRFSCGHPSLVPYNRYKTKDGKWFFVAANNNRQWTSFCQRLEIADFGKTYTTNDSRVENREVIDDEIARIFAEHDLKEWLDTFDGSGLPYGPVNDVVDALEHPQAEARDMVVDIEDFEAAKDGVLRLIGPAVKFAGADVQTRLKPPLLGEHTSEVLKKLGYNAGDIRSMRQDGVI